MRYKFDKKKMRNRRLFMGFTQKFLSHLTGISKTSILAIERGRKQPSVDNICMLAYKLELPPGDLFTDTWFAKKDNHG